MKNGRKNDVIIENEYYTDPKTGVEVQAKLSFTVWADENMKDAIKSVEGVTKVYNTLTPTQFSVYFDKRYDREYIQREIEAVVKCAS